MSLIDDLTEIYLNYETWHTRKLSYEEAHSYYGVCTGKNRILARYLPGEEKKVVGYVESWRINYEQFGRILCRLPFDIGIENITDGNICYVEGTWIHPDYRRGYVYKDLVSEFFIQNASCEFFVGEAFRKQAGMLKVLKRTDAIRKYLKEEVLSGQG